MAEERVNSAEEQNVPGTWNVARGSPKLSMVDTPAYQKSSPILHQQAQSDDGSSESEFDGGPTERSPELSPASRIEPLGTPNPQAWVSTIE